MQQSEVKMVFYQGIVEVVNKNPELCEGVLELAHSHMLTLWGPEGSSRNRWQLNLEKIIKESNGSYIIDEPIGWFVNCLQLIVSREQQIGSEDNEILDKVVKHLDEMVSKYSDCEPGELGFDVNDNYDKKTKIGEKKVLQLEQLKALLESLMEYVFTHGADYDNTKTNQLLNLFNIYYSLQNVMNSSLQRLKAKKGEKGKKADKKEASQNVSQVNNDDSNESGRSCSFFVPPKHCFSIKCISLILKALFMDKTPSHQTSLNRIRETDSFLDFILETLSQKVKQISRNLSYNGDEGAQSDSDFKFLLSIVNTLFNLVVAPESLFGNIQKKVTAILNDLTRLLFLFFPRRKLSVASCLTDDSLIRKDGDLDEFLLTALEMVNSKIKQLMDRLNDPDEEEIPGKLSSCLELFKLLMEEMEDEKRMDKVRTYIKDFNESIESDDVTVLMPLATLVLFSILKSKRNSDFSINAAKKYHYLAGDLDSTVRVEHIDKCPWMTDDNKYSFLPILFNFFDEQFSQADLVLSWVRNLSQFVDSAQTVLRAESDISFLLAKQANALSELIKSTIPIGPNSDGLLRLMMKQYSITGTFTKHFIIRSKEKKNVVKQSKFDGLIEFMNNQLTKHVSAFITHADKERNEREIEQANKRAAKNKTLAPEIAKARVQRESKVTANLVLKIENLDADLIKLGKRVKEKLYQNNNLQNRDFKLRLDRLADDNESSEEDEEEAEENNANVENEEVGDIDEENNPPPVHHSTAMGDITNMETNELEPARKKIRK